MRREIPCAAGDDELGKLLAETAARLGMRLRRRNEEWVLRGGVLFATNLTDQPVTVRASREEGKLVLAASAPSLPWTRAKVRQAAELTLLRVEEVLAARLRGKTIESVRLPPGFSPLGRGWDGAATGLAWMLLASVASYVFSFVGLWAAGLVVIDGELSRLLARAELAEELGYASLPPVPEILTFDFGDRLGASALLMMPAAAFLSFVMALAMVLSEFSRRFAALPLWMGVYSAAMVGYGLAPLAPVWAWVPFAPAVPVLSYLGYSLVWGRRGAVRREDAGRVRPGAVWGPALVIAGLLVAFAAPRWAKGPERLMWMALTRDRYMLAGGPLKRFAGFYYRYTLYAADAVRPAYGIDPGSPDRYQRTALVVGSPEMSPTLLAQEGIYAKAVAEATAAELAKAYDFVIVSADSGVVDPRRITFGGDRDALRRDLERVSQRWGAGTPVVRVPVLGSLGFLRDVMGLGFAAIYFALPPVLVLLVAIPLVFALALVKRRFGRKGVLAGAAFVFLGSVAAIYALVAPSLPAAQELREMGGTSPQDGRIDPKVWVPACAALLGAGVGWAAAAAGRRRGGVAAGLAVAVAAWLFIGGMARGEPPPPDFHSPATADVLLRGLGSPHAAVRYVAVYQTFRYLHTERAPADARERFREPLEARALGDPDVRVRLWACGALGKLGKRESKEALLRAMADPELYVRYRAAEALGEIYRGTADRDVLRALHRMAAEGVWYEGMYSMGAMREVAGGLEPRREEVEEHR